MAFDNCVDESRSKRCFICSIYGNLPGDSTIITWFWHWSFNTSCYLYKDAKKNSLKQATIWREAKEWWKYELQPNLHWWFLWWCNGALHVTTYDLGLFFFMELHSVTFSPSRTIPSYARINKICLNKENFLVFYSNTRIHHFI